jgi:hypothetical protein
MQKTIEGERSCLLVPVGSVFRRHPDLEPTGKLSLLGASRCSAERMNAYIRRRNPKAPDVAELYLRQGQRYGVRGDVAYCQMVYETRGWTAEISGPSWAPLTLVQWAEESSIEVQMQILYTFATNLSLPQDVKQAKSQIALLERAGWKGKVLCWEDLNGKWSLPGNRYGQDIVAIWRNMMEWKGKGEVVQVEQSNVRETLRSGDAKERLTGSVDWSSFCNEEMNWLKEQQLLPSPVPHPDRKVTWAELAVLLHRLESRVKIEG